MKVKTINLTGEETKIEFDKSYAFVEINNLSKSEILVSVNAGIVRGNDDVVILPSKTIVTIGDSSSSTGIKEIYISGNGEIQLIAKNYAEHSFKVPASGDSSDDNEALDFLPHPEGIYAYYDWAHGVTNTTWTDMVSGDVITCNEGNNFVIQDSYLSLYTNNQTNINVSDYNAFVIYVVGDFEYNEKEIFGGTNIEDKHDKLVHQIGGGHQYVYFYEDSSVQFWIDFVRSGKTSVSYALINTPTKVTLISLTSDIVSKDLKGISKNLSISATSSKYKAILLSNDIHSFDNIKENLQALHNKYFSA